MRGPFFVSIVLVTGCTDPLMATRDATVGDDRTVPNDAAEGGAPDGGSRALPTVPLGADAYRMWASLPTVRVGDRAYLRSTFDRAGGNHAVDASHFLRADRDDFYVSLDVEGPGALVFVRTNHWHGSPWHYVVDGFDQVVTETSTADPTRPVEGSVFEPSALFPRPLTETWSVTRGADLNWVPMAFERSLTLAYGRTRYGTGYYIFHRYAEGADHLSRPLRAWDRAPPDPAALALLRGAGDELTPRGPEVSVREGTLAALVDGPNAVVTLQGGASALRMLRFSVPARAAVAFGKLRLRVTWDDRAAPSIDAPVALFFGAGTLYNRDRAEWLVRGLFVSVRTVGERVELTAQHPMPWSRSARVELVGSSPEVRDVRWETRTVPYDMPAGRWSYFHATYRDHTDPVEGRDLVALDTRGAEGSDDWCGLFAGMSWTFSDRAALDTLEGDPRFFFDDADAPQGQGTGTEEWGGGGDYWGGRTMTLPLAGHPVGAPHPSLVRDPEDAIESAYRLLLADAMPFGRNARIQLEHGGDNRSLERYRTVTYWYGRPGACLVPTDALAVGDAASERAHGYVSPTATAPETLRSRFELGVDHIEGREVIPEVAGVTRRMRGVSAFTLRVGADNVGVMLRRRFDQVWPDQRAEVWVADDRAGAPFVRAGVWYSSGSNRCVYSNPEGELGAGQRIVQTSNRRWREDEFLVPRGLTEGRERVRVEVRFTPVARPLHPGEAAPTEAWWSESRYEAYAYVLP
jgi:hypothetical protein